MEKSTKLLDAFSKAKYYMNIDNDPNAEIVIQYIYFLEKYPFEIRLFFCEESPAKFKLRFTGIRRTADLIEINDDILDSIIILSKQKLIKFVIDDISLMLIKHKNLTSYNKILKWSSLINMGCIELYFITIIKELYETSKMLEIFEDEEILIKTLLKSDESFDAVLDFIDNLKNEKLERLNITVYFDYSTKKNDEFYSESLMQLICRNNITHVSYDVLIWSSLRHYPSWLKKLRKTAMFVPFSERPLAIQSKTKNAEKKDKSIEQSF